MKKKIIVGSNNFGKKSQIAKDMLYQAGIELIINENKSPFSAEKLKIISKDNSVIGSLAGLEIYDKQIIESFNNLKVISRLGSGLTNIDLDSARENNIKVFNTPTAPVNGVAELTVGMIINILRHIIELNSDLKNGNWNKRFGRLLENKCVLLIGYGNIGKRVNDLLEPFNATIEIFDPFVKKDLNDLNFYLNKADIVSLHVNTENEVLKRENFIQMKDGVVILNSSRGSNIKEDVIIEFINNGKIGYMWLDVFENEPYSGEIVKYKNVILTPHVSSLTYETREKIEIEATNNLLDHLRNLGFLS